MERDQPKFGQLVLTRRVGERIMIGKDISVTVTMIDGGKVRIGIEAPQSVKILRAELLGERE